MHMIRELDKQFEFMFTEHSKLQGKLIRGEMKIICLSVLHLNMRGQM